MASRAVEELKPDRCNAYKRLTSTLNIILLIINIVITISMKCIEEIVMIMIMIIIDQVAHGGNNIISLGKGSCPQPPPRW